MRKRRLGNTDLELSVIGLGTWAMGGPNWRFGWGPQDDKESLACIRHAIELGINWIDTAPAYGLGHAETLVGQALHDSRAEIVVATKCGRTWDEQGKLVPRLSSKSIRDEVEASLRRLRIDVIHLCQIHWPQPEEDIEEAWQTLLELRAEGKIRHAGVCNFSVAQLEKIEVHGPVASSQPPYSMLQREVETEHLNHCARHGIGVLAYSPLQKGILTDKFSREFVASLPPEDHRARLDRNFQEPWLTRNLEIVGELRQLAQENRQTLPGLAVAWVLRKHEVTSAIVGARRPQQLEQVVAAAGYDLTEDLLDALERTLSPTGRHATALR